MNLKMGGHFWLISRAVGVVPNSAGQAVQPRNGTPFE